MKRPSSTTFLAASALPLSPIVSRSILLPSSADQPRGERRSVGLERRRDRPIFLRPEQLDLALAVDDQAQRDRLHAAGRLGAGQLAPQDRRQGEADQIIERAARAVGVDQILIERARMLHRLGHRRLGDGVEGHPLDLGREQLLLPQHFLDVPADRLALAVGIGGEDQRVGLLRLVGDRLQLPAPCRDRSPTPSRSRRRDRPTRPWAAGRGHGRSWPARGGRGRDIFRWSSPWRAIRRRRVSSCGIPYVRTRMVRARGSSRQAGVSQADLAAGMAVEPAGEVELEQHQLHLARRGARQADDLVDRHRRSARAVRSSGRAASLAASTGVASA